MQITKEIVEYVGHLSRIELDEQEKQILSIQLTGILNFIDKLKTLDVDKVKPTSHILDVNNIVREDKPTVSLTNASALENAPVKQGNLFVVPKVLDGE